VATVRWLLIQELHESISGIQPYTQVARPLHKFYTGRLV
jgi:hypothetical protein